MDSVFAYLDYQAYLRDYYEARKRDSTFFTYRYMGRRLGLDAGFLVKVLQGKMHIALKAIPAFVKLLDFDTREGEYFDALVRYNRASSPAEIKRCFERLLAFRDVAGLVLRPDQYELYQKWYYAAVRELLAFYDFRGDFKALGAQLSPPIGAREARAAVKLLVRLGLVECDEQGRYVQTAKHVGTGEKWASAAIHTFQKETIRLAGESLDRHPKEARDISTVSVAVSHTDLEQIRELARQFRRSVLQLRSEHPADCVYQINVQVVPLSRIDMEGGS